MPLDSLQHARHWFPAFIRTWVLMMAAASILTISSPLSAQTNFWTNTLNGKWEDAHWSLGVLPDSSQSVAIVNAGSKEVLIDALTKTAQRQSLHVATLTLAGVGSDLNTLSINSGDTNFPLRVSNDLTVPKGGRFRSIDSSVIIDGWARINGGSVRQQGGMFQVNRAMFLYNGGVFHLTNGVFEGHVNLIYGCEMNQHESVARMPSLTINGGTYRLNGGDLQVAGTMGLFASQDTVSFVHHRGNVSAGDFVITASGTLLAGASYLLGNGMLSCSSVLIGPRGSFQNNGGVHVIENQLVIQGSARYYPPVPISANYSLGHNATLSAESLVLDTSGGFSFFDSAGAVDISGGINFVGDSSIVGRFRISGGTLKASEFSNSGAVIDLVQSGGNLIVSNLFSFRGYYVGVYSGRGARPAGYSFSSGTLSAKNIDLAADWNIGSSSFSGRIDNPGFFKMAGCLRLGDCEEQLGRFILASNAVIDFGNGNGHLAFRDSSAEQWNDALLTVTNWSGSLQGSGDDRLRFGDAPVGLTVSQLKQIRFVNPSGLPEGLYPSQILSSGEVVPIPVRIEADPEPEPQPLIIPGHFARHADGRVAKVIFGETNLTAIVLQNGQRIDLTWQLAGAGDFNGNGEVDILWRHRSGSVAIWLMGETQKEASLILNGGKPVSPIWKIATVADFNADATPDILWQNAEGQVAVWTMAGTNITSSAMLFNGERLGRGRHLVAVGDFDSDSNMDLVWQEGRSRVAVWLMNGTNVDRRIYLRDGQPIGEGWIVCGVQDFDNDGKVDLFFRHRSNRLALWLMNGLERQNVQTFNAVLGPGWIPCAFFPQ